MKRAVIFFHGDRPSDSLLASTIRDGDSVICTDGAAAYAIDASVIPAVVIGDFDSISPTTVEILKAKQVQLLKYPTEKNETDSELALQYALENRYTNIIILGLPGSRFDHMIANIFLLAEIAKRAEISVVTEGERYYFITKSLEISGRKGEYLSLIPIAGDVTGVTTKGLRYPLKHETLFFGKTRGVSNEFEQPNATVIVQKGLLLAVHTSG